MHRAHLQNDPRRLFKLSDSKYQKTKKFGSIIAYNWFIPNTLIKYMISTMNFKKLSNCYINHGCHNCAKLIKNNFYPKWERVGDKY